MARQRTPTRADNLVQPPDVSPESLFRSDTNEVVSASTPSFRPTARPPMALLILIDDDSSSGEKIRLRRDCTSIGREDAMIEIPHDVLVSRNHAEVIRELDRGRYRWYLRDCGSRNGTFVRVAKTTMKDRHEILMGSKRFRYQRSRDTPAEPETPSQSGAVVTATWQAVTQQQLDAQSPRLIERLADGSDGQAILLDRDEIVLGSADSIPDQITDPYLNPEHAKIQRNGTGHWVIQDLASKNGIWVSVRNVELDSKCEFQVGEQRFLFVPL